MSTENSDQSDLRERQIELLLEYSRGIDSNFDEIEWVFEDSFGSERLHNDYNDFNSTMTWALRGVVEEGDEIDVTQALVNVIANFDFDLYEEIKEEDDDLADRLKKLSMEYGLAIQRRVQRIQQGHDYWSNVRSDLSVRSNRPAYKHELIIDYNDHIEFDSSLGATAILARHFIQQLADAPDVLGDDVLAFMNQTEVERVNEISEELLEKFEEYELEGALPLIPDRELEESDTDEDIDEESDVDEDIE